MFICLKACSYCEKSIPITQVLCQNCQNLFLSLIKPFILESQNKTYRHYLISLFSWENDIIRELINKARFSQDDTSIRILCHIITSLPFSFSKECQFACYKKTFAERMMGNADLGCLIASTLAKRCHTPHIQLPFKKIEKRKDEFPIQVDSHIYSSITPVRKFFLSHQFHFIICQDVVANEENFQSFCRQNKRFHASLFALTHQISS